MSAPAPRPPGFDAKFASHAWWILLFAALAFLWLATGRRIDRVNAITDSSTWSVDAPKRDAESPTGFEKGQRKLIVPGHHNPSFWWIMEAQQSVEQGRLRLRHIDYDAQPDGRDIHRTAPYRWWLIAVGWLHWAFNVEPLGYAIERGALIADPILLALMLIVGAAYSARCIGSFAAIGFVVGGISLFPLAANFQPGAPDPHSLAWVFALGSILPLLAASRQGGIGRGRRIHFVVAGVFGGLGLWNNAPTQAPLLLATFLGAMGYEFIHSRGTREQPAEALNWRAWSLAGLLTTLGASIFEFAPAHFSWSLDSVNPIHAAAWWGFGEALLAAGIGSREGLRGFDLRSLALLVGAGLAIASWPVVGMVSGSGALLAPDFSALELANHPSGGIAPSVGVWLGRPGGVGAKWATLLPCVLLVFLLARVFLGRIGREERGRLVLVLCVMSFAAVLACLQLRWWNLFDTLALAGLTVLLAEAEAGSARARIGTLGAVLLLLPGLFVGFPPTIGGKEVNDLSRLETQALIARDFSYWLAKRGGSEPSVLFSTPVFSSAAAFYGGFDVVVSSDDENKTGNLTAVRIASANTAQEASILLNSRRITHVALPLWDPAMDGLVRIGMNLPADQPLPESAFSVALRWWDIPLWMRPMDYLIPNEPRFDGFELRALVLQAEQEPDLGLSRLTDFFVERGQLREAQSLRETLKNYPRSVVALGAIANVDFAVSDRVRLKDSLETLIPYLSRRFARNLPSDRRISLAALFVQTNHVDLAREQMTACFEGLDVNSLRTMTPGAVVNLVAMSRSLDIPFPDKGLEMTAMELIPPSVRAGLVRN